MKTTTPTHPAALGFLAALFSFTLLAPSAAGQESVKATRFTIESNKAQSILLDTTTLEAVDPSCLYGHPLTRVSARTAGSSVPNFCISSTDPTAFYTLTIATNTIKS